MAKRSGRSGKNCGDLSTVIKVQLILNLHWKVILLIKPHSLPDLPPCVRYDLHAPVHALISTVGVCQLTAILGISFTLLKIPLQLIKWTSDNWRVYHDMEDSWTISQNVTVARVGGPCRQRVAENVAPLVWQTYKLLNCKFVKHVLFIKAPDLSHIPLFTTCVHLC